MEREELLDEVILLDETGQEARFSHILTFLYEGERYVALEPMDGGEGAEDAEEAEVVLMRIVRGEEGDAYCPVENEVLLDEVFAHFLELIDELEEEE